MGSNERADALVQAGIDLYSKGELDAAMDQWRAALELQPGHARALQYLNYVDQHREALEESFRLAGGRDDAQSSAEGDTDSLRDEMDDPYDSLEYGEEADDSVDRDDPLGESDFTPRHDDKTSQIRADLLETWLAESRAGRDVEGKRKKDEAKNLTLIEDDLEPEEAPTAEGPGPIANTPTPTVSDRPLSLMIGGGEAGHDSEEFSPNEATPVGVTIPTPVRVLREGVEQEDPEDEPAFVWEDEEEDTFDMDLDATPAGGSPAARAEAMAALSDQAGDEEFDLGDGGYDDAGEMALDDEELDLGDGGYDEELEFSDEEPEILTGGEPRGELDLSDDDLLDDEQMAPPRLSSRGDREETAEMTGGSQGIFWDDDEELSADDSDDAVPDLPSIPRSAAVEPESDGPWFPDDVEPLTDAGSERSSFSWDTLESDDERPGVELDGRQEETADIDVRQLIAEERLEDALDACEQILAQDPGNAEVAQLMETTKKLLSEQYQQEIGDFAAVPTVSAPRHEIIWQKLDARSGFLLSRVDGLLTFEDIMDVSGMGTFEATRTIVQLLRGGIISLK